jgi:hypothetical protein
MFYFNQEITARLREMKSGRGNWVRFFEYWFNREMGSFLRMPNDDVTVF